MVNNDDRDVEPFLPPLRQMWGRMDRQRDGRIAKEPYNALLNIVGFFRDSFFPSPSFYLLRMPILIMRELAEAGVQVLSPHGFVWHSHEVDVAAVRIANRF